MAMSVAETRKRPTRACTARTPSRLAPLAPVVEKSSTKSQSEDHPTQLFSKPIPVVPEEKDRYELRRKWELASIINFFNTFRPILRMLEFTGEELETALLTCNDLLMSIHTALLKGIYPPSRVPLNRESWITVLSKKLKDRWSKVAPPPFPFAGSHGNELETYVGFDSPTRLIILRALCEVRLDQDDIRAHMEEPVKKGFISHFRKERAGSNLLGTTYWCENNPISGYRLYRDIPAPKGKMFRGRTASPPPPGQWETLASKLDEFQSVADTLTSSKFKQEIGLGKRLKQEVLPVLEAIEKKKARDFKRKQRQAKLLVSTLENTFEGRTRRDRKPVNYTFPEYDRSINEAIKSTRRATEVANGQSAVANGHGSHLENSKRLRKERASNGNHAVPSPSEHPEPFDSPEDDGHRDLSEGPAALHDYREAGTSFRNKTASRGRQRRDSRHYRENDYVQLAEETDEEDFCSDDEIEGEAIYDDDFVRKRELKRKKVSLDDEEYRGDEDVDVDEDDLAVSYSEDDEEDLEQDEEDDQKQYFLHRSMRRVGRPKELLGLRRSKRATRSKVNYSAYEDSEVDEDESYPSKASLRSWRKNGEVEASPKRMEAAEYSMESADSLSGTSLTGNQVEETGLGESGGEGEGDDMGVAREEDGGEEEYSEGGWNDANGGSDTPQYGDGDEDKDVRRKQLRFFDLNECAPADSPRDWMRSGFQDEREAEAG